jgi:hypothetical protein
MKTERATFLATTFALLSAPAVAQIHDDHVNASPESRMGPAKIDDMRGMMRTLTNDPIISKRVKELIASNPAFKAHFDRMSATMNSGGMMVNGAGGMNGSMMGACPSPKP